MFGFLSKIFSSRNNIDSACHDSGCLNSGCCSDTSKKITFDYFNPAAREIFICGDFNAWSTSKHRLTKDKTGRFKVEIELAPGSYQYKFLVDGNWMIDQKPGVLVDNAFGTKNSLIEI